MDTMVTTPALSAQIDALYELHQQRKISEAQTEAIKEKIREAEAELLSRMDSEGLTKSSGQTSRVSINTTIVPSVTDWDAFYKFIGRHKYYHLLERRPSVSGCRELFETKGKIPGVLPFTKRRVVVGAVGE